MTILDNIRAGLAVTLVAAVACTPTGSGKASGTSAYAAQPYNFRLNLTDAPNDDLKAVTVIVKHAEMRVEGGGKAARVIVAKDLGAVNLLDLQDGVLLPMADLSLPAQLRITQIRLVLNSEGNHIIKSDDSRCDLKTPSAQKTGVKLLIHQGVTIESGYNYSIVADFDAKKSVVLTGNGGCLLKPVIKLKSATRVAVGEDNVEEPVVPDDGSGQEDDDGSGFDSGPDESIPEIPIEDIRDLVIDP